MQTHSKVQKANKTLEKVKQFKVPTNVRVYAERPVTPDGSTFGIPTVRVDVERTAVKDLGIVKMASGGKGIKSTVKVKTYEQARNEALSWLEQRGFKSENQTFGKFGYTKNEPIGRQTNDGKVGFRIEHDSRSGAHINVWAGKEKGPHFEFDASEKTVKKIQKRFR